MLLLVPRYTSDTVPHMYSAIRLVWVELVCGDWRAALCLLLLLLLLLCMLLFLLKLVILTRIGR